MTAPCKLLQWDTEFFGVRVGRIETGRISDDLMAEIIEWTRSNQVRCLYFLCDQDHDESIRIAEAHNFHLVDVRLVFVRKLEDAFLQKNGFAPLVQIGVCGPEDVSSLAQIAGSVYGDTRFYRDRYFDQQRISDMYREWISKSCNGYADRVFVARKENIVVGYITCHLDSPGHGQIGLVGVVPNTRGMRVGRALVHAALDYFSNCRVNCVEVATQGSNLAAQSLYQSMGFRTKSLQLWYHAWFEGDTRT